MSAAQIGEFIIEGAHFDDEPSFDPALDSGAAADPRWDALTITYQADQRPIIIEHTTAEDELLGEEISEVKEELQGIEAEEVRQRLTDHLDATKQIFAFDANLSSLSDDAWEMIDTLEGKLAQGLDGIVYAPDDGFFDAHLKRICEL